MVKYHEKFSKFVDSYAIFQLKKIDPTGILLTIKTEKSSVFSLNQTATEDERGVVKKLFPKLTLKSAY
jgi:hypothetical protein